MRGAGDDDENSGMQGRKAVPHVSELVLPKRAKAETDGSARNVDGMAEWSLKASRNVGLPGGVQALSLRPSESLGALGQVPLLFAVLDCLDVRSIARLEMTSVALECSARAAASRRAQGNIFLGFNAYRLGLDPDALGARYLAATSNELVVAIVQDPDYCWPLPRGDTSTTFSLKAPLSSILWSDLLFHCYKDLRITNVRAAKGEAPTLVIEFRCRTRKEYEELKRLAADEVRCEAILATREDRRRVIMSAADMDSASSSMANASSAISDQCLYSIAGDFIEPLQRQLELARLALTASQKAADQRAADMDAALDDEFDDLLGSSDSDASDA